jgi:F420H(2)-dependent quinone reductase
MGLWDRLTSRTPPRPVPGTPGYRLAVALGHLNVRLYRLSGGRIGGTMAGAPVCVLHHRGAKTGAARETPLLYLADGEDIVLVASMGGSPKHPSWFHNLKAHPDVEIEDGKGRRSYTARVASPAERERLWPRLVEMYASYADYQARTDRSIPVVICAPR